MSSSAKIRVGELKSGPMQLTRLFHPRQDEWDAHFEWNGPVVVGRTTIGRATIDVLKINLPERMEHRRLLIASGILLG